jgi:hypothetical protein
MPFNPFALSRNAVLVNVAGGAVGAYLWKSHRVLGFVAGVVVLGGAATMLLFANAAEDASQSMDTKLPSAFNTAPSSGPGLFSQNFNDYVAF